MKLTLITVIVASFGVGFFFGKSQINPPKIQIKEVEVVKEKTVPVQIKNSDGDEAIAQAFTLFLAALGLEKIKVEPSEVAAIMNNPNDFIQRNSIKEKLSYREQSEPKEAAPAEASRWGMPQTESSVYKKVPNTPIPAINDPSVFLAKSKVINDAKFFEKLNGSYQGMIQFFDGKRKGQQHRVVININYFQDSDGNGTDGQSEILLYDEDGKNYSHSRGTGGNRNFLTGEDNASLVVKIVDKTFLHFINTKQGPKFANYYEDGKLVGTAKLFEN